MSLQVTVNSDYSNSMVRFSRNFSGPDQGLISRNKAIAIVALLALAGAAFFLLKSSVYTPPRPPRPCDQKSCDADTFSLIRQGGCYCLTSKAHDDWIKKHINFGKWCPIGSGPMDLQFTNKCPA